MTLAIRLLTAADLSVLSNVADDVFDDPINEASAKKFLEDPNHLLVVATDESKEDLVVGLRVHALIFIQTRKKPEMVILEVGVAPPYRKQGVGKKIMETLLAAAKKTGCKLAWLATEPENVAALALYKTAGGKPPETCIHIDFDL